MVYVDNMNVKNGDWIQCNMVADTDDELLVLGEKCGLRKEWVKSGMYRDRLHFEVAQSKKKLAIKQGAKEISMVELMTMFAVNVPDEQLSIAELHVRYMDETDIKGINDITVRVGDFSYCVPNYCLETSAESTTVEMLKYSIIDNPEKFRSFILYYLT